MTCRVYIETLGCRLNSAESEDVARTLVGAGCVVVEDARDADVVIVNTCAVTAVAARKTRHRLNTLRRLNPQARLAAIGCWASDPGLTQSGPAVDWLIPNADKARTVELILGYTAEPVPWTPGRWGHTRAFLAVQDGCDQHCTYCITRILRGPARSRPLAEVVREAQARVAHGAQELVLTGVCLGDYGRDLGLTLHDLIRALLRETGVPRLRLSSVEPWDVDEALLRLWENPRLCRQLHLPLQSGAESVLKRMGRRITTARFAELVQVARAVAPAMAITTDIMVGFPGESEADFAQSLAFVEAMGFSRLHVFPYSERPGTAAMRLPDHVPVPVREARAARMRQLGGKLARSYAESQLGSVHPVLWEQREGSAWLGWSDTYLPVKVISDADLYNRITPVRLLRLDEDESVIGEVLPQHAPSLG